MSILRSLAATLLLLGLAACAQEGSGSVQPPAAVGTLDENGGMLLVAEGVLEGVTVDVPAGALLRPAEISITPGFPVSVPSFLTISRAPVFGPFDQRFELPVDITVPFREGTGVADLVMLVESPRGEIFELAPDATIGTDQLRVATGSFSTYWVAERLFGGFGTQNFLPLSDGNTWNFDEALTVTAESTTMEPNFGGAPVFRLKFETPRQDFGIYLESGADGIVLRGDFITFGGESFQRVHGPAAFLPANVTLGREVRSFVTFAGYEPFGRVESTFSGTVWTKVLPTDPGTLTTRFGEFETVLDLALTTTFRDAIDGGEQSEQIFLRLAPAIGPIAARIFGLDAELVSGLVNSQPIVPPAN